MRVTDYDKLQLKLREYADRKASNGEIELANGILKAKCFIDQECEVIEENQLTNGWIPVSERLPDRLDEVMACNKDGVITIGYIRKKEGYYTCEHLPFVTEDIVAWMPKPPKYKEVSE